MLCKVIQFICIGIYINRFGTELLNTLFRSSGDARMDRAYWVVAFWVGGTDENCRSHVYILFTHKYIRNNMHMYAACAYTYVRVTRDGL